MMGGALVGDGDDERDRQATVTDFLDYTEHLPADIERSLTLLKEQDRLAQASTEALHKLLQQYGRLPSDHDAYDAAHMRREIAYLLDLIGRRRECASAEAHRLHEETVRHHKRLQNVKAKLLALPQPPSRDPTPQPAQKSPQLKRSEGVRLALKTDSQHRSALPKRRMIVPGEVLPPWNPDSPLSSDFDELEDEMDKLLLLPAPRKKEKTHRTPKPPREAKIPKEPKLKKDKPPKLPGHVGTNVHSSVAGISTSNALSLLTPPPEDARPGSRYAPWFRLTEWEMATLRKRMKKNAIWAPSDTMIRRELLDRGRGHDAYQRAKRVAEESGQPLLDEDDIQGQLDGLRELRPGEISADSRVRGTTTVNKGMDLNVRKKEKKAMMAQQQAALAAQTSADLTNQSLANLRQSFKTLFDRPDSSPLTPEAMLGRGQKRKRESVLSPSAQDLQLQAQLSAGDIGSTPSRLSSLKKLKGVVGATKMATASAKGEQGGEALSLSNRKATDLPGPRMSLTLHMPRPEQRAVDSLGTGRETRQSSRPSSARASVGPLDALTHQQHRASPRLTSAASVLNSATAAGTAAAAQAGIAGGGPQRERRNKRPAPGVITASQEGGAALAAGRRPSAPKKKGRLNVEEGKKQEEWLDEEVDPDEPRYCICNNVSYGTMICCENPHCEGGEWFHLDCVKLKEPPGRREKWWCPRCDPNKQRHKQQHP